MAIMRCGRNREDENDDPPLMSKNMKASKQASSNFIKRRPKKNFIKRQTGTPGLSSSDTRSYSPMSMSANRLTKNRSLLEVYCGSELCSRFAKPAGHTDLAQASWRPRPTTHKELAEPGECQEIEGLPLFAPNVSFKPNDDDANAPHGWSSIRCESKDACSCKSPSQLPWSHRSTSI